MRVVVTGATGYVGSRLVPELLGRGHEVVATTSAALSPGRFSWGQDVEWVRMDVRNPCQVLAALEGAQAVCYLVHSLASKSFAVTDARAAAVVRDAADELGVRRIVYLSGLVPAVPREELSAHLRSRLTVEEILGGASASTLSIRAGIVIGAGSTSFEIMRQVTAASPVQVLPTLMRSRVQPVSVLDVLQHLADALERDDVSGHLDLGAPEILRYADLMAMYTRLAGLPRLRLPPVPAPAAVVAGVAPLACAAPWWTVSSLVRSLGHDMVCAPGQPDPLARGEPVGVAEAIERSLRPEAFTDEATTTGGDPHVLARSDPAWVQRTRIELPRVLGPVGGMVGGMVGGAAHIAEHRIRGLFGATLA